MTRKLIQAFCLLIPFWSLKRWLLSTLFGYKLAPSARIGFSWFFPDVLNMEEGAIIGHLNVATNLFSVHLAKNAKIGRGNWITGFPKNSTQHFTHLKERDPSLYLGEESAITKNHHIDCTESVRIGKFVTIAGYQSQFLTHSINIIDNRQDALPIEIGDYSFVGTNVVLLGGATLPAYSVLGAKSLLNKPHEQTYALYGGVPAKKIADLPKNSGYFLRTTGRVT